MNTSFEVPYHKTDLIFMHIKFVTKPIFKYLHFLRIPVSTKNALQLWGPVLNYIFKANVIY